MKDLICYIKEDMNDNLFWKIDMFFNKHEKELYEFNSLLDYCREKKPVTLLLVKQYINNHTIVKSILKNFVDFIEDNIQQNTLINRDYYASFYNIIKTILSNKKIGIEYTNKKGIL